MVTSDTHSGYSLYALSDRDLLSSKEKSSPDSQPQIAAKLDNFTLCSLLRYAQLRMHHRTNRQKYMCMCQCWKAETKHPKIRQQIAKEWITNKARNEQTNQVNLRLLNQERISSYKNNPSIFDSALFLHCITGSVLSGQETTCQTFIHSNVIRTLCMVRPGRSNRKLTRPRVNCLNTRLMYSEYDWRIDARMGPTINSYRVTARSYLWNAIYSTG